MNHPEQYITNMKHGAVAGFKYFEMGYADQIQITVRGTSEGKMQISDSRDFENICAEIEIRSQDREWHDYSGRLSITEGRKALFFRFSGKGAIDFLSFEFMRKG